MVSNGLLKLLSVLLLIGAIGVIAVDVRKEMLSKSNGGEGPADSANQDSLATSDKLPGSTEGDAAGGTQSSGVDLSGTEDQASSDTLLNEPQSRLVVGVIGATPTADQIHSIAEVPWLESQVNRAFNQSKEFACQLLASDVPVKPMVGRPSPGKRGMLGRIPAVTVGLEVEPASRLKLPTASRGAIEAYLRDHRLAIEPTIYQADDGTHYIGTDCRTAFYPLSDPTTTIKAEPMIEDAIGRFRALGTLRETKDADGRTLVMAFRYIQVEQDRAVQLGPPKEVTELLFIHLSPHNSGRLPKIEAFSTSDARQKLHRLMTDDAITTHPIPTISASVRFEKFVLMGLYPDKPIVTNVRPRASGVMSVDTILRLTKSGSEENRLTFQQVLDQFATITDGV